MTPWTPPWEDLRGFLGGPEWLVIHSDGRDEPFDGERLVESLVHSGVPAFEAIAFYSEFLEQAAHRLDGDKIRLGDITDLVTTILMQSDHGRRAGWVRNYHSLYGIEREFPAGIVQDPGFIDPADGGALVREIRRLVREQLAPDPDLPGAVSRQAMDEAVERIMTIVRLCGFRRIPREFLDELVATLSEYSSGFVFPGTQAAAADRERAFRVAGDLIGAATLYANSAAHRDSVSTMLILAAAPAASHFLRYYGFMPRSGPAAVLRQMHRTLEAGAGYAAKGAPEKGRNAAAVAFRQLADELAGYSLRPRDLLAATSELAAALGVDEDANAQAAADRPSGPAAPESGLELLELARRFLSVVRIATDSSTELRDVRDAIGREPLDQLAVQGALLAALRAIGLSGAGHFEAERAIVTARMNVRSKIGEHAQEIAILVTDATLAELGDEIGRLVRFVRAAPARAGFLAAAALDPIEGRPSPRLPKDQFELLTELTGQGVVIVPVGTHRLLRALAGGSGFLDTLAEAVEGTYPGLRPTG